MRVLIRLRSTVWLLVGLLLAPVLSAAPSDEPAPAPLVDFAPAVFANMRDRYGSDEMAVLRAAIVTAVSRATAGLVPDGATVAVTVRDIAPSHPTRRQQAVEPAVDPTRTKFIGGADLAGEVRDAHGHVLVSIMYRYYPLTLGMASPVPDPWADARLAIDQFAAKLAAACRRISGGASPAA
jgi:hypothetical protein